MINWSNKNYKTLFKENITYAFEKGIMSSSTDFIGLVDNDEDIENFTILLLSVLSKAYDTAYDQLELVENGYNLDKATGDDLDNIGTLLGVKRPLATRSQATLAINLSKELTEYKTIADGSRVKTSDGIVYRLIETVQIPTGVTNVTGTAEAVLTGTGQNVKNNTLTIWVDKPDFTCTVYNPEASTGGSSTATDTEYRSLLRNSYKIHQKGNYYSYINYLRSVDGLDSYKLLPKWDGTGTVKIVTDPDNSVLKNTIAEGVKSNCMVIDEDVTVVGATKQPVSVYAECNVDIDVVNPYSKTEKEEIQSRIEDSIYTFINGGLKRDGSYYAGLLIGEDLIPHKLSVFVDSEVPELKNIIITTPDDVITIDDESISFCTSVEVSIE